MKTIGITALIFGWLTLAMAAFADSAGSSASGIYYDGWIDFNKNGVKDVYEDPQAPVERRVADLIAPRDLRTRQRRAGDSRSRDEVAG